MGPWCARLPARDGVCFATVSECLDKSRWVVNLFPKGKDVGMWSCYEPTGANAEAQSGTLSAPSQIGSKNGRQRWRIGRGDMY